MEVGSVRGAKEDRRRGSARRKGQEYVEKIRRKKAFNLRLFLVNKVV